MKGCSFMFFLSLCEFHALFLSSQLALKDFNFMISLTEQAVLDNLFSIAFDRRVNSFVLQSFVAGSSDARCLLVIPSFMQQCSFAFVY